MTDIMADPVVDLTPDLLFAALLVTAEPAPVVMYAVSIPFDDFFGPNVLFVDMTDDRSQAEAALSQTLDGVLVQRTNTSAAWAEVVR